MELSPDRAVIQEIILFAKPVDELARLAAQLPWDPDGSAPVDLTDQDLVRVIVRFQKGVLAASDIEQWADLLESREDVHVASEAGEEVLFEMANPLLNAGDVAEQAQSWMKRLSTGELEATGDRL